MPLAFVEQESLKTVIKCYPASSQRLSCDCKITVVAISCGDTAKVQPLLAIPCSVFLHIGLLKLTEWEMKIIENCAEAAKAA